MIEELFLQGNFIYALWFFICWTDFYFDADGSKSNLDKKSAKGL